MIISVTHIKATALTHGIEIECSPDLDGSHYIVSQGSTQMALNECDLKNVVKWVNALIKDVADSK